MEPHVAIRFKDVFRQVKKTQKGSLEITHTAQGCKDLIWFMSRYPLEISESDNKLLAGEAAYYDKKQQELEAICLADYKARPIESLAKPLRHYQAQAVEIFLKKKKILIGDDVGLGKTIIAIGAWAAEPKTLPGLVIAQTHLPMQWKERIEEFLPSVRVHIIKSRRPYDLPEADIYILSYSKIVGWIDILATGYFKSIVFDECQELRRTESQKYEAAQAAVANVEYVLGLSATPIYNYGIEIWNVMDIIVPGGLGSLDEFSREWTHGGGDAKGKIENPQALGAYLRENFLLLRRTRADVGRELPKLETIIQAVEYSHAYVQRLNSKLKELASKVETGSFVEKGQAARELDAKARLMTGVAKSRGVADYVKSLLENGEKVLLTGWHREVYRIWSEELAEFKPVFYTGSETPAQKEEAKHAFIRGDSNLMIISLRSGIGLDGLQKCCNIIVFGELDWSPQVHLQIVGRLERDGQQNSVTAIYLMSEAGTDPLMQDMLGIKKMQADAIINPTQPDLALGSADEARIKKLARSILEQ
jgi:SNF2 family DNA or RNA helicase